MQIRRLAFVILFSLLAHTYALAQVNINLEVSGQDALGARLAESLRDSLRKRRIFQISPDATSADATLWLGTLDPMDGRLAGLQTVYSVVITMKTLDERRVNVYVNSYLGVCGREQTSQCGTALADAAEAQLSEVLSVLKERVGQPVLAPK